MTITTTHLAQSRRARRPGVFGAVRRWHATRRARMHIEKLEEMSDHLLTDIGLTRDRIRHAVRHGRRCN